MVDIHNEKMKALVFEKGFLDIDLDPTLDLFAELEKLKKELTQKDHEFASHKD